MPSTAFAGLLSWCLHYIATAAHVGKRVTSETFILLDTICLIVK